MRYTDSSVVGAQLKEVGAMRKYPGCKYYIVSLAKATDFNRDRNVTDKKFQERTRDDPPLFLPLSYAVVREIHVQRSGGKK